LLECRQLFFGLREIAKHKVSFAKVFMRAAVPRIWPPPLVGSTEPDEARRRNLVSCERGRRSLTHVFKSVRGHLDQDIGATA
jgi:hypothetical protein